MNRCSWPGSDPLYVAYHDQEWGVPVHGDRRLFELLVLGGAQAGLSWLTILRKRASYRRAFARFDPCRVARFGAAERASLLRDPGIVRNRLKIESAVANARAVLELQDEFGSFDEFVWGFVGGRPIRNRWRDVSRIPAETDESRRMSRALRERGFRFVGPTICYAFMQAAGLVNDHVVDCFRERQVAREATASRGGRR
jgi:DNA-3-methyladenine glycosylase I